METCEIKLVLTCYSCSYYSFMTKPKLISLVVLTGVTNATFVTFIVTGDCYIYIYIYIYMSF